MFYYIYYKYILLDMLHMYFY